MYSLLFALHFAWAAPGDSQLTVKVSGAKSDQGFVLISVYKDPRAFPNNTEQAVRDEKTSIQNGHAQMTFEGLEPGEYAVAVAHDANSNGKLDKNALGIPTEGFGFSRNAKGAAGPPKFEKASIILKGGANQIDIKLRYL